MWYYNKKNADMILKGTKNSIIIIAASFSVIIALAMGAGIWVGLAGKYNVFLIIVTTCVMIGGVAAVIGNYSTRKLRSDIITGNTVAKMVGVKSVVLNKEDVEPGSGVLYIPILGDLFPKLFGQKMKRVYVSYIITENNEKYDIPNDIHGDVNSKFTLHFGERSGYYLGCEIK